jgi:hypothetical protein
MRTRQAPVDGSTPGSTPKLIHVIADYLWARKIRPGGAVPSLPPSSFITHPRLERALAVVLESAPLGSRWGEGRRL